MDPELFPLFPFYPFHLYIFGLKIVIFGLMIGIFGQKISTVLTVYSTVFVRNIHIFCLQIRIFGLNQGWEFAHRFFERIAHFLPKSEQMSNSLKKGAIRSFFVSDLSDLLTVAHLS